MSFMIFILPERASRNSAGGGIWIGRKVSMRSGPLQEIQTFFPGLLEGPFNFACSNLIVEVEPFLV